MERNSSHLDGYRAAVREVFDATIDLTAGVQKVQNKLGHPWLRPLVRLIRLKRHKSSSMGKGRI